MQHAHGFPTIPWKLFMQPFGARQCAAIESQTLTVRTGGALLPLLHDLEVVVEGRDLVHLGLRELHLLRERRQVRRGEMAVAVVDPVQMLDQQVAPPRLVPSSARTSSTAAASTGRPFGYGRAFPLPFVTGPIIGPRQRLDS
jgi:hypothetical protein